MKNRVEILHNNIDRFFSDNLPTGDILIVDDFPPLFSQESRVTYWHTRFSPTHAATPEPDHTQSYDCVLVRLPKSHEYFDYILQCVTPLITENGTLYVYGLNDEGVKAVQKKISAIFENVEPAYIKSKGRIVQADNPRKTPDKPASKLSGIEKVSTFSVAGIDYPMTYYPGMFASGELDAGTELLLTTITPSLHGISEVLDFACGSGIIARVLHDKIPQASFDLLDNDSISLVAARANMPQARSYILGESLASCPKNKHYDLIVSNPPIHTEKSHQRTTLFALITDAKKCLQKNGRLVLVVQARIPLDNIFAENFTSHDVIAQTTKFKVWEGRA